MEMSKAHMKIFCGNANRPLAELLSQFLSIPLGDALVSRFSDGEIQVEIRENVRGQDVFILQSTSAPSSDNLMELLLLADALRRSSASRITAVIPYFGFARQDRRIRAARVPITAKVVADMMSAVGIQRVLTIDLHAEQIQGFFYIPVDNIYATPVMVADLKQRFENFQQVMVVSPDVGGVVRARALSKDLQGSDLAIIDKRRPSPNEAQVMHIIGEVKGKHCVIVDDIVDTAQTLAKAATALKNAGALEIVAYATHAVLSGSALAHIMESPISELVITDTIQLSEATQACPKIRCISMGKMLAESIKRICVSESLSSMFL